MVELTTASFETMSPLYNEIRYTSRGKLYIALEPDSDIPIFLTPYNATDVEANRQILDHPSLCSTLISPPISYLKHAQFWYVYLYF